MTTQTLEQVTNDLTRTINIGTYKALIGHGVDEVSAYDLAFDQVDVLVDLDRVPVPFDADL